MHELALRQRRELGDRAEWHIGDVTWGLRQHEGREDEWTIRVWRDDDGAAAAGSWLREDKGWLEFDLRRDRLALLPEILDEPRATIIACADDDEPVRAALAERGFSKPDWRIHVNAHDIDDAPEPPPLPTGF